jgi:hypothetical protein
MFSRLSVRPSARMEQLGSHDKYFNEILYLGIFRKSVETIRVSKVGQEYRVLYMKTHTNTFIISRSFHHRIRNVTDEVLEKIKTHI